MRDGLRRLIKQVIAGQEQDRRRISRGLNDRIAQTLLGISLRLSALHTTARRQNASTSAVVSSLRSQVKQSVRSMKKLANGIRHA